MIQLCHLLLSRSDAVQPHLSDGRYCWPFCSEHAQMFPKQTLSSSWSFYLLWSLSTCGTNHVLQYSLFNHSSLNGIITNTVMLIHLCLLLHHLSGLHTCAHDRKHSKNLDPVFTDYRILIAITGLKLDEPSSWDISWLSDFNFFICTCGVSFLSSVKSAVF